MNDDAVDEPAGGETGPEPDAQAQFSDIVEPLFRQDDQWRVRTLSPGCLALTRGWPDGSADTLIIMSPEIAYGVREDPSGLPVWSVRGTHQEIVAAALLLHAPDAPDAPTTLDTSTPTGFWT